MFDSVTAADIPDGSELVAGYVDGAVSKWSDADWLRFPGRILVRITVLGDPDADVFDVESGAGTPAMVPGWVLHRRALGREAAVYVNLSNLEAVRAACADAGEAQPHYWLAHYGAPPIVPEGFVAIQYANDEITGGHYDASAVADVWPGIDGGGTPMDRATYGRDVEPFVKDTIRLMLAQDPDSIAAIEKAAGDDTAVRTIGTKILEVAIGALSEK